MAVYANCNIYRKNLLTCAKLFCVKLLIKLNTKIKIKFVVFFVIRNCRYNLVLFLEKSLHMAGSRSFGPETVDDVIKQKFEVARRQAWFDQ